MIEGVRIEYTPTLDGDPDPGEVVWTWVPYEDDPSQGKDRPVVIVGRKGAHLGGVALTSKDHDRADSIEVGTGSWDSERRPSYAKLDRIIDVDPHTVRREGAVLDKSRFDALVAALADYHGASFPADAHRLRTLLRPTRRPAPGSLKRIGTGGVAVGSVGSAAMSEHVRVGVLGCGNVGAALVQLVDQQAAVIEARTGSGSRSPGSRSATCRAPRDVDLPEGVLTRDAAALVADPDVDVVVEVIGGIEPARELITTALAAGKPVVTANKELLANVGAELFAAADAAKVDLLFEAAVAGASPSSVPCARACGASPSAG